MSAEEAPRLPDGRLNLDEPRWSQNTYWGRARHFFNTTNPLNLLCSPTQLERARAVVQGYKSGGNVGVSDEEVWRAKTIYDSAFHPDTGEKMLFIGRMSAQVPMNMTITGCMLTFYKTTPQVVFWQWCNQSFNAIVNYTNRSGSSPISKETLATSYVAATGGALATALSLNALVKSLPPLVGRLVPFVAVCAANSINIPLMRRLELQNGVTLMTEKGEEVKGVTSRIAAREGIAKVVLSRIGMAAPGMVLLPLVMNNLERRGVLRRLPWISAPLQIGLLGVILTFATPLCCAIFEQKASIHLDRLEEDVAQQIRRSHPGVKCLYYNKGL